MFLTNGSHAHPWCVQVREYTPSLESHVPGTKRPKIPESTRRWEGGLGVEEMMTTLEAALTPVTEGVTCIVDQVLTDLQSMRVELRELHTTTASLRRAQEQQR